MNNLGGSDQIINSKYQVNNLLKIWFIVGAEGWKWSPKCHHIIVYTSVNKHWYPIGVRRMCSDVKTIRVSIGLGDRGNASGGCEVAMTARTKLV